MCVCVATTCTPARPWRGPASMGLTRSRGVRRARAGGGRCGVDVAAAAAATRRRVASVAASRVQEPSRRHRGGGAQQVVMPAASPTPPASRAREPRRSRWHCSGSARQVVALARPQACGCEQHGGSAWPAVQYRVHPLPSSCACQDDASHRKLAVEPRRCQTPVEHSLCGPCTTENS